MVGSKAADEADGDPRCGFPQALDSEQEADQMVDQGTSADDGGGGTSRWSQGWSSAIKIAVASLGTLIGVVVGIFALTAYVDNLVNKKAEDLAFLQRLSRQVRPAVIFDVNESILADQGAASLIGDIDVSPGADERFWTVTIAFSEHLPVEPILEPLDGRYGISARRGRMNDWVFELEEIVPIVMDYSGESSRPARFRLELVR